MGLVFSVLSSNCERRGGDSTQIAGRSVQRAVAGVVGADVTGSL